MRFWHGRRDRPSTRSEDMQGTTLFHLWGKWSALNLADVKNPDRALWRDIHLQKYDDPRSAGAFVEPREDLDWKKRVQDREFVARILRDWGPDRYEELVCGSVSSTLTVSLNTWTLSSIRHWTYGSICRLYPKIRYPSPRQKSVAIANFFAPFSPLQHSDSSVITSLRRKSNRC